jgi:hypothetical protein
MNIDYFFIFTAFGGIHRRLHPESRKNQPFYLPFGKAEDTASPALVRLRRIVEGSR